MPSVRQGLQACHGHGVRRGEKHTVEPLQREDYEDVEANDPGDGNRYANPDPGAVMPEAELVIDGFHEGLVRLAGGWLLPAGCIAML